MAASLKGSFATRRDAEMTVEQLVQVLGIPRTDVFVAPIENANSAGEVKAGSDLVEGEPDPEARPALSGRIEVSVGLDDEDRLAAAEAVFHDHGAEDITRT